MAATPQVKRFKGLNNVSDPLRLGLGWLQRADDMLITDDGALMRRPGYAKVATGVMQGAYATLDFTRLYLVNGGALQRVNPDLSLRTLRTGLAARDMHWAEVNKTVYYTNGVDSGIILGDDSVVDWTWAEPAAPALAAGTGTLAAGHYQVVCTYLLPDGRETGTGSAVGIDLVALPHQLMTGWAQSRRS